MKCNRCGAYGITYGHQGLCGVCYMKHRAHQRELQDAAYEARQQREAAKAAHPAGRRRHIRLVSCTCSSPTIQPCALHKEEGLA